MSALDAYTTGAVERWAGSGRYETAAVISSKVFSPGVPYVLVATGTNFPDALAGAAAAAKIGAPVLLVTPTSIPTAVADELTRLAPPKIAVLGSPTVVAMVVQIRLGAFIVTP
jgi:putative cell wall-binding protein